MIGLNKPFTENGLDLYLKAIGKTQGDIMQVLLDEDVDEYVKYQIAYILRTREDKASVLMLANLLLGINQSKTTPILRHDVAFLLGDLKKEAQLDEVRHAMQESVENPTERSIVKHEVSISYIEIWGVDAFIEKQKSHPCRLISESAQTGVH